MNYSYPILEKVYEFYNKMPHDVNDVFLVCCQHIMEPQAKMFEYFIRFGFDPKKIILLGKAYSTSHEVLEEVKSKEIQVTQPNFSGEAFDKEHEKNCSALLNLVANTSKVIILDDGAELIKTFIKNRRNFIFGVEQTSSGFRRLENEKLPAPVFNVGRSVTKLTQESPLVARHLCERIIHYLQEKEVMNPKIFIVGLGPIGESILEIFKEEKLRVGSFDTKHDQGILIEKIRDFKPNIIIGATGTSILSKEDIESIVSDDFIFLISASSSDREFPVAYFRNNNKAVHDDIYYKNLIFVNNGFPFSFMGNRYEMTPMEIEKTICLLIGSVMSGITRGVSKDGFLEVPAELENLIN